MELSLLHYISSPDNYSTVSENEVTKKMPSNYEKLQEKGDLWWHTSDEEMETMLDDLECQVYLKKQKRKSEASKEETSHTSKSGVNDKVTKNYYDALEQEEDDDDNNKATHTDSLNNVKKIDDKTKHKEEKQQR